LSVHPYYARPPAPVHLADAPLSRWPEVFAQLQ
jgi:hypothetical protein